MPATRMTQAERSARTRQAILDAARDLFVSQGYRATSIRDIAAAAGISHPGLLRHFSTKDDLLASVVEELERANDQAVHAADDPARLPFGDVARSNAAVPGYLPLFAALTGEASTESHPAHDRMRRRYAILTDLVAAQLAAAARHGAMSPDRDPRGEAVRIAAAWDGLQLIDQYLPGRFDIPAMLDARTAQLAQPIGWRDPGESARQLAPQPVPVLPMLGIPDEGGYRVGRERRAQIVADATALFARDGYTDTSLREIAERVGMSKSALLHHFPSKEELLRAVLAERDRSIGERGADGPPERAADEVRRLSGGAEANSAAAPGLIELYAVLSCEAATPEHPAHAYFAERFRTTIDHLAALLRLAQLDGDLPAHRDPDFEALWLVALWDGLQYQWLYDRDAVDIAAHLRAHLADILPR